MTGTLIILLMACAYLAIFVEARFDLIRLGLRCQLDLLPPLMVFASLKLGLPAVVILSVFGGLLLDSISANPLGVTTLSLFVVGWLIHANKGFLLRDERYAQFVLGMVAGVAVPLISLTLLANLIEGIIFSGGLIWSLLVNAIAGGILTPLLCKLLEKLERAFSYQHDPASTWRSDREIKRGR